MSRPAPTNPDEEKRLMEMVFSSRLRDDPYAFVMTMYPWGKPNTPLANHKKPRDWQATFLKEIAAELYANKQSKKSTSEVMRRAVSSGRGIGKSALNSWMSWWNFSCHIGSSTVIAANGKPQLMSYTFPEIRKWVTLAANGHWADATTTNISPAPFLGDLVKKELGIDPSYWFIEGKLWSEENPDAFAGAHNHNGIMILFDEASGIPTPIWSVTEGYFTEPVDHRYWFAFSNFRRSEGAFFDCFHSQKHRWQTRSIDSRSVEGLDHSVFNKLVQDFGEDSDIVRVEVRGLPPLSGFTNFIGADIVREAQKRELPAWRPQDEPLVLSVDVAHMGKDQTVLLFRRGKDARSIPMQKFRGLRVPEVADKVYDAYARFKPDIVVIDANGVGAGVADLVERMNINVRRYVAQEQRSVRQQDRFHNLRAESWYMMRDWLTDGCIPDDPGLEIGLITPAMGLAKQSGKMLLESKKEFDESPDEADALAMSMIARVRPRIRAERRTETLDYNPFS